MFSLSTVSDVGVLVVDAGAGFSVSYAVVSFGEAGGPGVLYRQIHVMES